MAKIDQLDREEVRHFAGLYPHQVEGVAFLIRKGRAILGDDMGLGKTRQAIVAMELGAPEGTILVVCPASLKLNWTREIRLVDPGAAIEVIGVDKEPVDQPRWIIVNYDILSKHAERLHAVDWAGVILDEAHFIRKIDEFGGRFLLEFGQIHGCSRLQVEGAARGNWCAYGRVVAG